MPAEAFAPFPQPASAAVESSQRHLVALGGFLASDRVPPFASWRAATVDTAQGLLYRKPMGKVMTKKRQGTARHPPRYLAHLRRQARNGRKYVVEDYQGGRNWEIKTGWSKAVLLAGELARTKGIEIDLSDVTPHTLKHTAITWSLQKRASPWDAVRCFPTSVQTIGKVYGHHDPNHQRSVVEALNKRA